MRRAVVALCVVMLGGTCSSGDDPVDVAQPTESPDRPADVDLVTSEGDVLPPPPEVRTDPVSPDLLADLDAVLGAIGAGVLEPVHLRSVGSHGDPRAAWVLADLSRFVVGSELTEAIALAFEDMTGVDLGSVEGASVWKRLNDHLIGWDLPAFDEYVDYKERLYVQVEPGWTPFFADDEARIDWRLVGWGGVFIDDRPLGSTTGGCPRGCIPALDDPPVTGTDDGDWYPDDAIVFGVTVNGESRAYPKNIMEVHEMVNDTLGGRRIGIPYCTLCASAQLYFTDSVPGGVETPVLRTSGLLSRSNKVMYDLITHSVFDTFTGEALSGPLRESNVVLEQGTVVASTWREWRRAHPDTTIVAADGGLGREYPLDPLRGRDDNGPIFPVGDIDGRLEVQELVVGVLLPDGTPVAFPVVAARAAIETGGQVEARGVRLTLDGDGLRAETDDGEAVPAHQAFWFAWSQFHPGTEVWAPG